MSLGERSCLRQVFVAVCELAKLSFKNIFRIVLNTNSCTTQSHRKKKKRITKIGRAKFDHILKIGSEFMVNSSAKRAALKLAENIFYLHTNVVHAETLVLYKKSVKG